MQLEQSRSIRMQRSTSNLLWQSLNGKLRNQFPIGISSTASCRWHALPACHAAAVAASHNSRNMKHVPFHASSSLARLQQCSSLHSSQPLHHAVLNTVPPFGRGINTGSSSGTRHLAASPAAAVVQSKQQASFQPTAELQASVAVYLSQLSEEQQQAAHSTEQHVRVIAGPGSGKTRVVAARVAWLIASGVEPESLLVITFTRKAAQELVERLQAVLGSEITQRLMPCTFHALCTSLLRRYPHLTPAKDFQIASEEDCEDVISSLFAIPAMAGGDKGGLGTDKEEPGQNKQQLGKGASWFRRNISHLKNFTLNIQGRTGQDLINEVNSKGCCMDANSMVVARLVQVYDQYVKTMADSKLLDFDDLLHHCLDLIKGNEAVKAGIHRRWRHVLVDESQDTNACQFDLVKQLTGAASRLFMVGDPDQAIYGFRGANSHHLSQEFCHHYGPAAVTHTLADNYRCREPIIQVADIVRFSDRRGHSVSAAGRSMRSAVRPDTVVLLEEENEYQEAYEVVRQLKDWKTDGYAWKEMAILFRLRHLPWLVYKKAIEAGIPCSIIADIDFFKTAEVKVAVALLRLVVDPSHAGEVLKRHFATKSTAVQIPLAAGLGVKFVEKLQQHIEANPASMPWLTQQQQQQQRLTIGECLLGDLPLQPPVDQAVQASQQWMAVQQAAGQGHGSATLDQSMQQRLDELERLSPPWQKPEGLKGVTKKQQAAIDKLRGLVLLCRMKATAGSPADVVQLLLDASCILPVLQQAAQEASAAEKRQKWRRCNNLKSLIRLARNVDVYASDPAQFLEDTWDQDDNDSSFSVQLEVPATGKSLLQKFYDYCALQGDAEQAEDVDKVQLLTMHRSKGLEFPCVVIIRAHEGIIPCIRADTFYPGALAQETNLLYVAITRAKEHCLITWPREYCQEQPWVSGVAGIGVENDLSSLLLPVLRAVKENRLPGVQAMLQRSIKLPSSSSSSSMNSSFSSSSGSSKVWRGDGTSWGGHISSSSSSNDSGDGEPTRNVVQSSRSKTSSSSIGVSGSDQVSGSRKFGNRISSGESWSSSGRDNSQRTSSSSSNHTTGGSSSVGIGHGSSSSMPRSSKTGNSVVRSRRSKASQNSSGGSESNSDGSVRSTRRITQRSSPPQKQQQKSK